MVKVPTLKRRKGDRIRMIRQKVRRNAWRIPRNYRLA